MVTIKQIPTDTSLTASTNVISMQYPNTILNTKMTLPQLVGPIDVVSPEHSSGDQSHEFQIASSKNASIEFSKADFFFRPTPCGFRQVVQQLSKPVAHEINYLIRTGADAVVAAKVNWKRTDT